MARRAVTTGASRGKRVDFDESPLTTADMVNHPPHYTQGGIECIDAISAQLTRDEYIGYLRGCIAKYNWRMLAKGSATENNEKLIWYANRLRGVLSEDS